MESALLGAARQAPRLGSGIGIGIKPADTNFTVILAGKFGWGGRIRTSTILINSEVSYRLDHAPAAGNPRVPGSCLQK